MRIGPTTRALAAAAALAVAGCGSDDDSKTVSPGGSGSEAGAGSTGGLVVKETDFKITPANLTVKEAGAVTLAVRNDGETTHALEIEGQGQEEKTDSIAPGDSAELTITLKKGTYEWYCPIGNHKELGMKGTVTVGGGSSSNPSTTPSDDSSDEDDDSGQDDSGQDDAGEDDSGSTTSSGSDDDGY